MEFLIRFVQIHETFRKPEIEALAVVENVNFEFLAYTETVSSTNAIQSSIATETPTSILRPTHLRVFSELA